MPWATYEEWEGLVVQHDLGPGDGYVNDKYARKLRWVLDEMQRQRIACCALAIAYIIIIVFFVWVFVSRRPVPVLSVVTNSFRDQSVTGAKLEDGSVTTPILGRPAVDTINFGPDGVTEPDIGAKHVRRAHIKSQAVPTVGLRDGAVRARNINR